MRSRHMIQIRKEDQDETLQIRKTCREELVTRLSENPSVQVDGNYIKGALNLANEYILPNANNLNSLKNPPLEYEGIRKEDWKSFVDKILSEDFQKKSKAAKEKRSKNEYNHHFGSTGYAGLLHKRLDLGVFKREIDCSEAWLLAHRKKDGKCAKKIGKALHKKPDGSRVQGLGQFIIPSMYFNIPDPTELEREQRIVTPKSVTNDPKATLKSVTKVTPKSVTKVTPKSVTNDLTVCPKSDKNINTPPLPSPAQNPPQVDCETTSKITPRRSSRLTPLKRKVDGRKSLANGVVYLYEQKGTTKEPVVVKPMTARKFVLRKNTRRVVKARKENKSSHMNIVSLMIESSLPRSIMIVHDLKTFGVYWESRLDKQICNEVIEFTELSNSVLEICINGHWVLVAIDMTNLLHP
ncbi:hypothetical protein CUMW_153150, partial [Citrus unshiu]